MATIEHSSPFDARAAIAQHWRLFLVEGIVLMVLGVGAILVPVLATVTVAIFLGWLFLIGGTVGLVTTLMGRHAPGFWWAILSAIVTIVAGLLLVGWPLTGAFSLTLVLAAFLAADGVISIVYALEHRRQLSARSGWLIVNGVLDLALAVVIFWLLPGAAFWVLGLFIGIDFLFGGASLIGMALAAHRPAAG
jgi:uncharacterized membrane protein HdeD (DUF308 family)